MICRPAGSPAIATSWSRPGPVCSMWSAAIWTTRSRCGTSRSRLTVGWSESTEGSLIPITRGLSCCGSTGRVSPRGFSGAGRNALSRNAQRRDDFAGPAAFDHRLLEGGLAIEHAAVDRAGGGDDLAAASKQLVAEFENPQIGPCARPQPRYRVEHV